MLFKKRLLLILFFCSPYFLSAQDENDTNKLILGAKIYFGLSGNPGLSIVEEKVINLELNITKPISRNFGIQSGVHKITKSSMVENTLSFIIIFQFRLVCSIITVFSIRW